MSRRSPHSRHPQPDDASDSVATVVSQDPVAASTPSLESLLASCGALQSALRHNDNPDVCSGEALTCEPTEKASSVADELRAEDQPCESSPPEPESLTSPDEVPAEATGWIDTLRLEFRASIEELKTAQSSAAASQSAVLKTLTEIMYQSSTVRDSSDGGLERKLGEFEERILNRISQISGLTVAADARKPPHSSNCVSNVAEPVKKNPARSWAEIRDELVNHSDSGASGFEHEPGDAADADSESESAGDEAETSDDECIVEVPQAVDPETLDEKQLRIVFYEREEFIAKLIGRLRHQYQKSSGHLPAEQLRHMAEHLPQDLAAQVLQTLQQLNELARVGELELSLERARLARQLNQLDHSRQLIEHNARQLGLTVEEDGTVLNPQKLTLRQGGSRRWLSKLGFGL